MIKDNKILYKCKTIEDTDLEEYQELDTTKNKIFIYTYEINPTLRHMLNRGYGVEEIINLTAKLSDSSESTYFYWDKDSDSYFVNVEKGETEGLSPKKYNTYLKIAIDCFNEFFNELNKTY